MADQIITKQELIDAQKDAKSWEKYWAGAATEDVITRLNKVYPTHAKALAILLQSGGKAYATLAALNADKASFIQNQSLYVLNDGANNGWYRFDGTNAIKSDYDPLSQSKKYTDQTSTDFIPKEKATDEDILIALTDVNGQRTWLESEKSGKPTSRSSDLIATSLEESKKVLMRKEKTENLLFAILDLFDLPTSLSLREDGSFSDIAIKDIQTRIAVSKAFSNTNQLAVWGSSTIDYSQVQWRQLAEDFGIANFWQGGRGGETVETICARHGSVPMLCKFSNGKILATTDNQTFTASNIFYGAGSLMPYEANINGAVGTISFNSGNTFNFTRTDNGSEITVDANKEYPAISAAGLKYQNAIGIINIGKNNLTSGDSSINSPEYVLEYTKKAYEYMKPYYKFVLVLGHFVDTEQDAAAKARVLQCNALLKDYFKERFYDLEAYLSSEKIWLDTGITPTADDLAKQAAHQKPASLSLDNAHMNTAANTAVILVEIKNLMKSYGWYNSIGA